MPKTLQEIYDDLIRNPQRFLEKNIVRTTLGAINETRERQAFFAEAERNDERAAPTFYIASTVVGGATAIKIPVFYVKQQSSMSDEAMLRVFNGVQPPTAATPSFPDMPATRLLVTPQLSGCSIVYQPVRGTGPFVAHVAPEENVGNQGYILQGVLQEGDGCRFVQSPEGIRASVYGRRDYLSRDDGVNVIGVSKQGSWSLFAQIVSSYRGFDAKPQRVKMLFN